MRVEITLNPTPRSGKDVLVDITVTRGLDGGARTLSGINMNQTEARVIQQMFEWAQIPKDFPEKPFKMGNPPHPALRPYSPGVIHKEGPVTLDMIDKQRHVGETNTLAELIKRKEEAHRLEVVNKELMANKDRPEEFDDPGQEARQLLRGLGQIIKHNQDAVNYICWLKRRTGNGCSGCPYSSKSTTGQQLCEIPGENCPKKISREFLLACERKMSVSSATNVMREVTNGIERGTTGSQEVSGGEDRPVLVEPEEDQQEGPHSREGNIPDAQDPPASC